MDFSYYELLAVPALAFLGRVAGASWGPRQVGEVSTSLAIGFVSWHMYHEVWAQVFPYAEYELS